jgi:myo-inositol 2-dehydrogenase/D-chiro-inositol 1-dehydrogenase
VSVIEDTGQPVQLGFMRRYDPAYVRARELIAAGALGRIEIFRALGRDTYPPSLEFLRTSGGLFLDMAVHDLDLARFLVGEEFVVVNALGASLVDKAIGEQGDCDTAAVHMQTASGKIAVITNSRRATYGYDQRIEVHGSKGMLRAGNVHNTTVEVANAEGFHEDPILNFFTERYGQAYANEVLAFIDGMAKGVSARPNGHDGLQAQKLADAATESWSSGKPVKVV